MAILMKELLQAYDDEQKAKAPPAENPQSPVAVHRTA